MEQVEDNESGGTKRPRQQQDEQASDQRVPKTDHFAIREKVIKDILESICEARLRPLYEANSQSKQAAPSAVVAIRVADRGRVGVVALDLAKATSKQDVEACLARHCTIIYDSDRCADIVFALVQLIQETNTAPY